MYLFCESFGCLFFLSALLARRRVVITKEQNREEEVIKKQQKPECDIKRACKLHISLHWNCTHIECTPFDCCYGCINSLSCVSHFECDTLLKLHEEEEKKWTVHAFVYLNSNYGAMHRKSSLHLNLLKCVLCRACLLSIESVLRAVLFHDVI